MILWIVPALLAATPSLARGADAPPNILLLIADDLGVDRVGAYKAHPDPGNTPVIDQLADDGMLFLNAWADPFCSATRATLLTGRHGFRTGIGTFITGSPTAGELPLDEITLPQVLAPSYRNAAVGKWHLSNDPTHPLALGFEHHHGSVSNLPNSDPQAYFAWDKNIDGVVSPTTTYATTDTVDEALAFIAEYSAPPNPEPWFLWVAFNAPHKPYHAPPPDLHTISLPPQIGPGDDPLFMKALTEAMDTEIGRLLATMDPAVLANTIVIFVGDNGTNGSATTAPFPPNHAKGTVYQGGVHVPLIVVGPGVIEGGECNALVSTTDVFATVTDLAGLAVPDPEDSISFAPYFTAPGMPSLRSWVYAERFSPDHTVLNVTRRQAVRDLFFKLRRTEFLGGILKEEFYDLTLDPFELTDLFNLGPLGAVEQASYDQLVAHLSTISPAQPWTDAGLGLPGTMGALQLSGTGALAGGDAMSLDLAGAQPNAATFLFIGFSYVTAPLLGGTLVPAPDALLMVTADAFGGYSLPGVWPLGVPPATPLYYQVWQSDLAAPLGAAASNGLMSLTP